MERQLPLKILRNICSANDTGWNKAHKFTVEEVPHFQEKAKN